MLRPIEFGEDWGSGMLGCRFVQVAVSRFRYGPFHAHLIS